MTIRFLVVPVAVAISAAFIGAAASPAAAAPSTVCTTTPAQIRAIAATAAPEQARKALGLVNTGEKLCEAGGRNEASKKFAAAAKVLNTDYAVLTAAPTAQ